MSIFYKFKAAKNYDTISFDGATSGLILSSLKSAILQQKKVKSSDFDLVIENAQTGTIYQESEIVPKNTSVIVKRVPAASKPLGSQQQAALNAANASGSMPPKPRSFTLINNHNNNSSSGGGGGGGAMGTSGGGGGEGDDEDSRLNAMMYGGMNDWIPETQKSMIIQSNFNKMIPNKPPPSNYLCHRCGKPGHYIQNCPTNGDPRFNIARGTNGIPTSMLKRVEGPGGTEKGVLKTKGGDYVVMQASESDFEKALSGDKLSAVDAVAQTPKILLCNICGKIMENAVTIPCCKTNFCDSCITHKLIDETRRVCPVCETPNVLLDEIKANKLIRNAVDEWKMNGSISNPAVLQLMRESNASEQKKDEDQSMTDIPGDSSAAIQQQSNVVPDGQETFGQPIPTGEVDVDRNQNKPSQQRSYKGKDQQKRKRGNGGAGSRDSHQDYQPDSKRRRSSPDDRKYRDDDYRRGRSPESARRDDRSGRSSRKDGYNDDERRGDKYADKSSSRGDRHRERSPYEDRYYSRDRYDDRYSSSRYRDDRSRVDERRSDRRDDRRDERKDERKSDRRDDTRDEERRDRRRDDAKDERGGNDDHRSERRSEHKDEERKSEEKPEERKEVRLSSSSDQKEVQKLPSPEGRDERRRDSSRDNGNRGGKGGDKASSNESRQSDKRGDNKQKSKSDRGESSFIIRTDASRSSSSNSRRVVEVMDKNTPKSNSKNNRRNRGGNANTDQSTNNKNEITRKVFVVQDGSNGGGNNNKKGRRH